MTDEVKIDVDRPQNSSALIQNNNGNDTSTGVGAQEKSTSITDLLENKVAKMLGVLVCGWVLLVLVQGGMVGSLETKDCGFVTLLFFLVFFRCWRHYYPEAYRSFTDATQSLSADYLSIPNDIQQLAQQLVLPSSYIRRLFYCSSLVSAMTSVVLSVMRLALQDFGKKEVENKESRDFALKVFYGLTLAEALVLLFAKALSFPIRWNYVGLVDGPGDDLEVGLRIRENSVGLVDGPRNGPEDGLITRGNSVRLADGPGDGLEVGLRTRGNSVGLVDGPGNGPEDGLITRGNSVGLADGPGDGLEVGLRTRGNSVGLADGPGDGSEDGLITKGNSVELADEPGDGLEVGLITRGNSVGLADGPEDGPGDRPQDSLGDGPEDRPIDGPENGPGGEPEDGSENGPEGEPGDGSGDVPVNQSNECKEVAQMDWPANQSNDFNSEGPADSLPNLRQRRREIPQMPESTIVLKIRLHCQGCARRIRHHILKIEGVKYVAIDLAKDLVTVKGTMDAKSLLAVLKKNFKRTVEVVAGKEKGGGGGSEEKKDDLKEGKEKTEKSDDQKASQAPVMPYQPMFMGPMRGPMGPAGHMEPIGHMPMPMGPMGGPMGGYMPMAPQGHMPVPIDATRYDYFQPADSLQIFSDENPNACSVM